MLPAPAIAEFAIGLLNDFGINPTFTLFGLTAQDSDCISSQDSQADITATRTPVFFAIQDVVHTQAESALQVERYVNRAFGGSETNLPGIPDNKPGYEIFNPSY